MLVHREMSHDQAGNVVGVNDQVSGENITYTYDDLDRVTNASAPLNESYAYSAIGNITSKNSVPYTYGDPAHIHAVTAFNSTNYSYDANGSLLTRGAHAIRYDAERRPVRVNDGAAVLWRASYDGDGARRKRVDSRGTIHYLGGYERNVGNGQDTSETITKYYRALGRLVAIRKNGILYWIGTDHLGGTIRVADNEFNPVGQMRYSPYSVSRDDPSLLPADYLFTDQQLDESIGLYWYGSRAYDPSLGRFGCPDSIVPSAGNPQSFNRFSHALNNPVKYTDPSGHNPYDGAGIVVYDNPSYLPEEQRQALYEHNSDPSISNGSQGTVRVHESDDDGGGRGGDPLAGLGIIDVRDWGVEPSYLPMELRQLLYEHNTAVGSVQCAAHGDSSSPERWTTGTDASTFAAYRAMATIDGPVSFGIGLTGGGTAEAGIGLVGGAATGGLGGGVFVGGEQGTSVGGFADAGGYAGTPWGPAEWSYPRGTGNGSIGALAGVGGGFFLTNAGSASKLAGPFDTISIDVGVGPLKGSVQIGWSGDTFIVSLTVGAGGIAGVSKMKTDTWTVGP